MNLSIPAPITVLGKPYSLLDLARYVTSKERRYNRTAEEARSGRRLVSALERGDGGKAEILDEDLRFFAEVVERPSCGWGAHEIEIQVPEASGGARVMKRAVHASTAEYLSLIDAVAEAARSLPPLVK